MITSDTPCPVCGQILFVTNSARFWCSTCQAEIEPKAADPLCRDMTRNGIAIDYAVERALYADGEND